MASPRTPLVMVCVLCLTAGAWAQEAASVQPAKVLPRPEPVLSHIPAGTLGFAVVPNAAATGQQVDKFLADLGVSQMLPGSDPDNPDKKMPVLDLLRGMTQLGGGFNPKGGVAVAMLDPKAFDIDLLQLIPLGGPPEGEAGGEAAAAKLKKIPFVIFVPGTGVKEVFGAYEMQPAGKHTLISLRIGPTYAAQLGGYVLLSPNDKALDAVLGAQKKAVEELPPEQAKMLAGADVAYYVNMKVAGPIINQFMKLAEEQAKTQAGPMAPLVTTYMGFYRDLLQQLEAATVAGRFVQTGLVFEEMISFKPDSAYGKAMAAVEPAGKVRLSGLPNLPYALAIGSVGQSDPQTAKIATDVVDGLLKSEALQGLPEEEKTRCRGLIQGMSDQVQGMQMVVGGAPTGSGLFGVSFVIHCKDAAKVKALLGEEAKLAQAMIRHFGGDEPKLQKLLVRYIEGVETVGSVTADAIEVQHPDLDTMKEDDRAKMKKVLGEDKVRFLIAAADNQTVVVTFGGSRPFLAEALKAAAGKGTIGTSPGDLAAMKHLPAKANGVMLLNGGNIYDLIVAGIKTMAPETELPPFKVTCKTPIAMGSGTAGRSAHVVFYVPTDLVKELAGVFMMLGAARQAPVAPPVRGPDDF